MNSFDKFRIRLIKKVMYKYGARYEKGNFHIDDETFTSRDFVKYFFTHYGRTRITIKCEEDYDECDIEAFETTSEIINLINDNITYFESLF